MTYQTPPDPSYEKARLENEARRRVENTEGVQAARQAQRGKDDVVWQAQHAMGDVKQAGSFLDRIAGWFKRK